MDSDSDTDWDIDNEDDDNMPPLQPVDNSDDDNNDLTDTVHAVCHHHHCVDSEDNVNINQVDLVLAEAEDDMKIEEAMADVEEVFILTPNEKKVALYVLFKVRFIYFINSFVLTDTPPLDDSSHLLY